MLGDYDAGTALAVASLEASKSWPISSPKGVRFEAYDLPEATIEGDIHVWGPTKTAFFKDPSGNILAINSGM